MPPIVFRESERTNAPHSANFSPDDSKSQWKYTFYPTKAVDINNAITQVLGTTIDNFNVGLNRVLPTHHPIFSYEYASEIMGWQGLGTGKDSTHLTFPAWTQAAPPPGFGYAPHTGSAIAGSWLLPKTIEMQVEFKTYKYNILDNSIIFTFGPDNDNTWTSPLGIIHQYVWCNEWRRFFEVDVEPLDELAVLPGAAMNLILDGQGGKAPFLGNLTMPLRNSKVKMTWHNVPLRYVTSLNCNFDRFRGMVNQFEWPPHQVDPYQTFSRYKPGELLYLNWSYKKITQPRFIDGLEVAANTITMWPMLVDIEFYFKSTVRTASFLPQTPNNNNFVQSGFNLLPLSRTRSYFYATINGTANGTPPYFSFPMEALFVDPDNTSNLNNSAFNFLLPAQ